MTYELKLSQAFVCVCMLVTHPLPRVSRLECEPHPATFRARFSTSREGASSGQTVGLGQRNGMRSSYWKCSALQRNCNDMHVRSAK